MAAGLKQKTHKVFELEAEGYYLTCIVHYDQMTNPYHLYVSWYDGGKKLKQLARYGNLVSVIEHVRTWMHNNHIGFKGVF
jgi:hypothetical protein